MRQKTTDEQLALFVDGSASKRGMSVPFSLFYSPSLFFYSFFSLAMQSLDKIVEQLTEYPRSFLLWFVVLYLAVRLGDSLVLLIEREIRVGECCFLQFCGYTGKLILHLFSPTYRGLYGWRSSAAPIPTVLLANTVEAATKISPIPSPIRNNPRVVTTLRPWPSFPFPLTVRLSPA